MSKPIELSHRQWKRLLERLKQDYPLSVLLLREKAKAKLGFVSREHKDWDDTLGKWRKNCIMLDFYSESKRTFFIMKYSEYIQQEQVNDDF
jgi:hypothetical protein